MMKKLAIVTSHPIQYNAPLFRLLTERGRVDVKVFYTWGQTEQGLVYDPDFKREFKWDIPLLEGYEHEFVENTSKNPGAGHFNGIRNFDLHERINRYNPDTLLVLGWSFHSHLNVLRHYHGKKKIVFRGDSNLVDEAPGLSIKKAIRRLFLKWVFRHVDFALYTGTANKAYYLVHGLSEQQLLYAPHAVENERFADADGGYEEKAKEWRKALGIDEGGIVFLFAGKLEPKNDPGLLIDAFLSLRIKHIKLVIVGNGILEAELKQQAGGDNRIVFLDFQNQGQMPVVYRLGDVFVLPSKGPGETWGLSVNEAMACGRAVIVSDKCGCAHELVTSNGILFPAGNKDRLAEALQELASDRVLLKKRQSASVNQIKQFTFEQVAKAIEFFA
jgi:glycosyltransferase involved in cell wall biosynthesis